MIGHRDDAVEVVIHGKWPDEIDGYTVPSVIRDRERMQGAVGSSGG